MVFFALLLFTGCSNEGTVNSTPEKPDPMPTPSITGEKFGYIDGEGGTTLYTLTNASGNTVKVTDYGGIITSILVDGVEMVIGFDKFEQYREENPYFGALIGRYGNRIADAKFSLDGKTYQLTKNNNGNQLHGGIRGFDKYIWSGETATTDEAVSLTLRHVSPDGDEGFPGELTVACTYTWTNDNELRLDYEATTDKPTIVNLTNHTYFNIGSQPTVESHLLRLDGDQYTPTDEELIPLGHLEPVAGTPFDFRTAKPIGRDIQADHPQLKIPNGYDHNWALNGYDGSLREFALVTDPESGRKLRCFTTEPGVQIWTTNFKPGQFQMRGGRDLPVHGAICLETQHFPDSPNQEAFRTPRLNVGETYRTTTVYRFE